MSSPKSLFQKVWDAHTVRKLANGQTQLLIGTHLIHEVTSPQAFGMLRDLKLPVLMPHRTFATVDHIIPTNELVEPYKDSLAQAMMDEVRKNCAQFGITFFDRATGKQGIVHIVGPEQGITQPGTTIACGDSHTSTHGAFGALAFGIGTTQIRDVLATQTMALGRLKVRRINVNGALRPGVYAKDVILTIIQQLGVEGGVGYAYEYAGTVIDRMSIARVAENLGTAWHTVNDAVLEAGSELLIKSFVKQYGMTYTILNDPTLTVMDRYAILGLPTTLLMAPDGQIRWRVVGEVDWAGPEAGRWITDLRSVRR